MARKTTDEIEKEIEERQKAVQTLQDGDAPIVSPEVLIMAQKYADTSIAFDVSVAVNSLLASGHEFSDEDLEKMERAIFDSKVASLSKAEEHKGQKVKGRYNR